jgi:hypothetical protein
MNDLDVVKLLDRLAELKDEATVTRLEWEQLRDAIVEPVRKELDDLDAEYMPKMAGIQDATTSIETNIRQQVLALGNTAKGARLMAVYNKGRTSWDTKGLDGFAAAHPEMERFRKTGEPSVTIRTA